MTASKTLVAGIGNIFNGDDGFGSEVAQRLAREPMPEGVHVEDYGIRGVHLAYELLEGYDLVVLVDALRRGEAPGTVFVLEPEVDLENVPPLDSHQMDPRAVLGMVAEMGGEIGRLLLVGCEPADIGEGIGLSPPVAAAVTPAARTIQEIVKERADRSADLPDEPSGFAGSSTVSDGGLRPHQGKEDRMIRKLLFPVAFLAAVGAVVKTAYPDLVRYLKIRKM